MDSPFNWLDHLPSAATCQLEGESPVMVHCAVPDLIGAARGAVVSASAFSRQPRWLPTSILAQTVIGKPLHPLGTGGPDAPLNLRHDLSTARVLPWAQTPSLMVLHDLVDDEGNPVGFAPRQVLKRVLRHYSEQGWTPQVAPMIEVYFLTEPAGQNPNFPLLPTRIPFDLEGIEDLRDVIADIFLFAAALDIEIDGLRQSDGASQFAITLPFGAPLERANDVFFLKSAIRAAARRNGLTASFMAAPVKGQPGSTLALGVVANQFASGRSTFANADGTASKAHYQFIGGLQSHLAAAMPLLAPYGNSYLRHSGGRTEPMTLDWAHNAPSLAITSERDPQVGPCIRNRVAGSDTNPYLNIATTLACGYLGLIEERRPSTEATKTPSEWPLPGDLAAALDQFELAHKLRMILGDEFSRTIEGIKRLELATCPQSDDAWDQAHLMTRV